MSCEKIQAELVAYHFGTVSAETRQEIEEHLLEDRECLKSYLALKREIETAEPGPRPSAALRERLRRSVARELAPKPEPRRWSWWERPAAFGFAGAAAAAAILAMRVLTSGGGALPYTLAIQAHQQPAAIDGPR